MIKLEKGPKPQVLIDNAGEWLEIITDKLARNEIPSDTDKSRYRHPDIKNALVSETAGKCAYCESKIRHIAYGDVEHIIPKSLGLAHLFEWDNLTLACDICNTNKSNHVGIIDPYVTDPDQAFKFLGPMIIANPGNAVAENSVLRLDLNRIDLIERRVERIKQIIRIIMLIEGAQDNLTREAIRDDLFENELSKSTEYVAFTRSVVEHVG